MTGRAVVSGPGWAGAGLQVLSRGGGGGRGAATQHRAEVAVVKLGLQILLLHPDEAVVSLVTQSRSEQAMTRLGLGAKV